jgi:hypothetical protein
MVRADYPASSGAMAERLLFGGEWFRATLVRGC